METKEIEYIIKLYDPARQLGEDQIEGAAAAIAERYEDELTAAEEQVAVTREALAEYGNHKTWCELEDDALKTGPRVDTICTCNFDKALSAAPKRGRVIYRVKRRAKVYANGWAEVAGIRIEPSVGIVDTEEFTVTVREAKQPIRPSTEPSCYRPDIDTGEDAKRRDEQERYPNDEELLTGIGPGGRETE